jgi:predicted GIY-YIG superfamily endonuclease
MRSDNLGLERVPGCATIYQLVDLDTWDVLYIGSTIKALVDRLSEHKTDRAKPWIRNLFESRRIAAEILATVPVATRREAEVRFIKAAVAAGSPLVNVHHRGGAGPNGRSLAAS